jgi:hypothetical protein
MSPEAGGDPGMPGREAEDMPGSDSPSQEELRARLEEQLRKLKVEDLMVESVVSILNLTARRIAKEDERDLEQARVGIDAIRAWLDLLPEQAATQIRSAVSELQVLYAQAVEGKVPGQAEDQPGTAESQTEEAPRGGPEPRPRLWTPPGSS